MVSGDNDHIYDECGNKRLLTAGDYTIEFGKYKGLTLDEVNDEGYLRWLKTIAAEKQDWFLDKCLSLKV
jgi:uncharacterized protein (DUF3820 family)